MLRQLFSGMALAAIASASALAQSNPVQISFLPQGRSGEPNTPVTIFGTVINSSDEALDCAPRFGGFLGGLPAGTSGQLRFFPWDGTSITGTANQTVTIAAGGRQDYIVEASFDRVFTGIVSPIYRCTSAGGTIYDASRLPAVNDLAFNIQSSAHTDIILITDTLTNDGVARVGSTGPRAALMTVAAVNIGDAGTDLIVEAGIAGFSALHEGLDISVCETDASGTCISASGRTISIASWAANETRLFAVRARIPPEMGVPFYPDILRLLVLVRPADVSGDKELTGSAEVRLSGYGRFGLDFAGTALEGRPHTSRIEQRLRLRVDMSCETDGGVAFNSRIRLGTVHVTPESETDISLFGAMDLRGFNLESYGQTFSGLVAGYENASSFDASVYGSGDSDEVETDQQIPFGFSFDPLTSLSLNWQANAGYRNDYQGPGRVRCAIAPAQPDQPNLESLADSVAGTFNFDGTPELGDQIQFGADGSAEIVNTDGSRVNLEFQLTTPSPEVYSESGLGVLPITGTGAQFDSDRPLNVSAGERIGYLVPQRYRAAPGGGVQAQCAIMYLSGTPATEADAQTANRDAGVYVLVRDGVTLTADELATCNP